MRRLLVPVLLALSACSSDGGNTPQGAVVYETYLRTAIMRLVSSGPSVRQGSQSFLDPASAAAAGIEITPGVPANSYTFSIPVNIDDDAFIEAVMTGSVQLNGSLFTFGEGFGGSASGTVDISGGEQTLTWAVDFLALAEGVQISGTATLTDTITQITSEIHISASNPLVVKLATGDPDSRANVCIGSASGEAEVESHGPTGDFYSGLWTFAFSSTSVHVSNASYTDPVGMETEIPDSSFSVQCEGRSISEWAGTYDFHWFCNPQEEDDNVLVITVIGANRIHVMDDGLEYDATAVPGNPGVVRGFFLDNGYREDFDWTLAPDGQSFTQSSTYVFLPPLTGGGVCGGVGLKH